MSGQFPPIEPYDSGMLDTGDGLHILDDAGHGGGNEFMPLVLGVLQEFAVL